MSTQSDFVPPQYLEICREMQDRVPTEYMAGQAARQIEAEFGAPLDALFSSFDDTPLGAASIGQVHRAITIDGRPVAVKLQYPGIEHKFRVDIATMIAFCQLALPHQVDALKAIEANFDAEFDYIVEARNMERIARNTERAFGRKIVVPHAVWPLCSRTVLTMDLLDGEPLVQALRARFARQAAAAGQTVDEYIDEQKRLMGAPKSLAVTEQKILWYSRLTYVADVLTNALRALHNGTLGWWRGPLAYEWHETPINVAAVLRQLGEVSAQHVLIDGVLFIFSMLSPTLISLPGVFNADQHPGNVMWLPDGRLGLVDFGQTCELDEHDRYLMARMVVALHDHRRDDVVRLHTEMGARTRYMTDDIMWRQAVFWLDREDEQVTGGRNISDFFDWMESVDPTEQVSVVYCDKLSPFKRKGDATTLAGGACECAVARHC